MIKGTLRKGSEFRLNLYFFYLQKAMFLSCMRIFPHKKTLLPIHQMIENIFQSRKMQNLAQFSSEATCALASFCAPGCIFTFIHQHVTVQQIYKAIKA